MRSKILTIVGVILVLAGVYSFQKSNKAVWTKEQLMEPAQLANMIQTKSPNTPIIYNIGPAGKIPGAIYIGSTGDAENLAALKGKLEKLPKDSKVVIYCGCCPFEHCPNVRPALKLLNEMGFAHAQLLNLPHNLKADWIDKGYPVELN